MTNADKLNEYRIFNLSAQTFLPLVASMKTNAFELLMMEYRSGKTDLLHAVAKLECLHSMEEEIITKAKLYEAHAIKEQL